MPVYINGIGAVSPQLTTADGPFLADPVSAENLQLKSIDPGYREFIPADQIRRMGRIIKMGVAAARLCLTGTGCEIPAAIVTGTGLGCIEDTEKFLGTLIKNREEFLTPTSFIQSTHNTVGAQIALLLKCHGYNFAYVHRGNSFESALTDAMMKLETGQVPNILAGGLDELTSHSFAIQQRLGFWKRKPLRSLDLYTDSTPGTIAGEGAAFFFLEPEKKETSSARLLGVDLLFEPSGPEEIFERIGRMLQANGLAAGDLDLLLTGKNGDPASDRIYDDLAATNLPGTPTGAFKHLCGEYMTASSFGMWLAVMMLRKQTVPPAVLQSPSPGLSRLQHILIWNHFRQTHHALILLSRA